MTTQLSKLWICPLPSTSDLSSRYHLRQLLTLSHTRSLILCLSINPCTSFGVSTLFSQLSHLLHSASAVTFVGLIYSLILSFFVVVSGFFIKYILVCTYAFQVIALAAREKSRVNRLLYFSSLVILRLVSAFIAYFFLSVCHFPSLFAGIKPIFASAILLTSKSCFQNQPHYKVSGLL